MFGLEFVKPLDECNFNFTAKSNFQINFRQNFCAIPIEYSNYLFLYSSKNYTNIGYCGHHVLLALLLLRSIIQILLSLFHPINSAVCLFIEYEQMVFFFAKDKFRNKLCVIMPIVYTDIHIERKKKKTNYNRDIHLKEKRKNNSMIPWSNFFDIVSIEESSN